MAHVRSDVAKGRKTKKRPSPRWLVRGADRRRARRALAAAVGRSTVITRRRYLVRLTRLPDEAPALSIAHMTDLHMGRITPEGRLRAAIEAVNDLGPDAVLLTGDYVAHGLRFLPRLTHCLRRLRGPVFATMGNHDHQHGAAAIARALEAAGVHVLSNESTLLEVRGRLWRIVGIDDAVSGHDDLERAFSSASGEPTLALTHLAELAPSCARRGASLILSGHTHGGVVTTGGVVAKVMRRIGHRYVSGWYQAGHAAVYVNRGLGAAVFPWRSRQAGAEVAGIDLTPARRGAEAITVTATESRTGTWPEAAFTDAPGGAGHQLQHSTTGEFSLESTAD